MTAPSPSALRCPSCGAPVPEGAATCSYCRATLGWGPGAPVPPTRSVRDAAAHWARSIFGAPRNFADLIQSVQVRDEVFERIVTEVARREVRGASSDERPAFDGTARQPGRRQSLRHLACSASSGKRVRGELLGLPRFRVGGVPGLRR